jgi:four helix bundle protein
MYIESYKQLVVWQKSMELSKELYKATDKLPQHELYGLTSQMRRCVISIPSNIAEGYKRSGLGEYLQFLSIADASAAELETQLLLAKELYSKVDFSQCEKLLQEIQKMLIVMIKKLREKKSLNAKRLTLNANEGFTALITVLIVSAITLTIAATTIFLSTSESLLGFSADRSHEALQIAESCTEEAYFRLKKDVAYSGGTILFENGSCAITLTGSGGKNSTRTITASSTVPTSIASFTRRIVSSVTLLGNTTGNATTTDLTRWQE